CCARQNHFVSLEKSWTEAQSYCRENYTDLAVIESPEDNEQLLQTAVMNLLPNFGWIGLYRDKWSWQWSMGNISLYGPAGTNFTNWASTEPDNAGGKENCGTMSSTGFWADSPCSTARFFICYQGEIRALSSFSEPAANRQSAIQNCRQEMSSEVRAREDAAKLQRSRSQGSWVRFWSGSPSGLQLVHPRSPGNWYLYVVPSGKNGFLTPDRRKDGKIPQITLHQCCTSLPGGGSPSWTGESGSPYFTQSCCARQYHFVSLEKSWTEAQSYCRENYTDLAVIDSPEDNEQLLQTAGNPLQYAGWIGLYRDQWSWKWSMGNISLYSQTGSNFTSWATGEPDNFMGHENCVVLRTTGFWHDNDCSVSFPFICYGEAGDPRERYFLVETSANFTAAQRYCRERHTDLASVRNRSENEEIRLTARGHYVWIGLFMEPWKWSSPSYSAFYNWDQNQPDNSGRNENCAALALTGTTRGRWSDTDCAQRFPFFCFS
uniref:C-type lectin domain-containing protein n=1 Tax=Lepisosteus oculatus TaxID=7918 RepID=W5LW00_LEPOC